MNVVDKIAAVLRRDFLTAIRYRAGLAALLLATAGELGAFYYLSHAVGAGFRPDGMAYFPFVLVGTGFFGFLMAGTHALLTAVRSEERRVGRDGGVCEWTVYCSDKRSYGMVR